MCVERGGVRPSASRRAEESRGREEKSVVHGEHGCAHLAQNPNRGNIPRRALTPTRTNIAQIVQARASARLSRGRVAV